MREEKVLGNETKEQKEKRIFGGLTEEKSKCCDALIILNKEGLISRICSKCKKPVWEQSVKKGDS